MPLKRHNGIVVLRLTVCIHRHKLVLVVIDAVPLRLYRCALGACLVRVDRRDLLEVIVAVGIGGLKLGNNIAQLAARPLVGQEEDRLVVGALVGVDIVLEPSYLIGRKQVVACVALDARGVCNLNRFDVIGRRAFKNPVFHVHVIADQRNQRCGNLGRHEIALLDVVRMHDGDDQVLGHARKLVRVHTALGGLLGGLGHLVKGGAINLSADKCIDLHKVAQLIIEGDVAGLAGVAAVFDLGGIELVLGDGARNILEHLLEFIGVRRSLVEVGILGTLTELISCVGRSVWIVARRGVHELVFVARPIFHGVGSGICTVKDTDGVDGSAFIFHVLGGSYGIIGNRGAKGTIACRRTVGKEHNNLLGILATRGDSLGQLHAKICLRGAGRLDGGDCILKFRRISTSTRRQALHNLRIVIFVVPAIRIVADLLGLFAGELDNRNLMLLRSIINLCILLGDGIDKGTGGRLECVDAFGRIFATHGTVHRSGRIKH